MEAQNMFLNTIFRSVPLNLLSAAAGMLCTLYISWLFGLEIFATYTINIAKLSLILFGLEILPSSFIVFRQQDDLQFSEAYPSFYAFFSIIAVTITYTVIATDLLGNSSWFMILYIILLVTQRYFDCQSQARGIIAAYFWIPAISNIVRLISLAIQVSLNGVNDAHDLLWSSMTIGMVFGQIYMVIRFPELLKMLLVMPNLRLFKYLFSLKSNYYPYYINSIIKRVKDTYIPLLCDVFLPGKAEVGRFLLYFRAVDFSCAQIRMVEVFLTNRNTRSKLITNQRKIMLCMAVLGQIASIAVSLVFVYQAGLDWHGIWLALAFSFYVYPYVYELLQRNDSYAKFVPSKVTISLVTHLFSTIAFLVICLFLDCFSIPMLVAGLIIGQSLAAISYKIK